MRRFIDTPDKHFLIGEVAPKRLAAPISACLSVGMLLASFMASPVHAVTVYCTNCSDRFTQAIEKATSLEQLSTLIKDYSESVTQTAQQLEMVRQNLLRYQNMLQNTASLPAEVLSQLKGSFSRLADLTSQLRTSRGDVGALSQVFREVYREQGRVQDLALAGAEEIHANVDEWGRNVDRAAEATFQLSGAQLDNMLKDKNSMDRRIDDLLSTPDGQMKALQSGNTLAAMQLQESRQLRELMATVSQSQIAAQMKAEKQEQLSEEQWRKATETDGFERMFSRKYSAEPF